MRPIELRRLDALMASAMIAHEAIFEMSRELRAQGSLNAEMDGLLRESARIVTVVLPNVTATARRLGTRWSERDLLESSAAAVVLRKIEAEMERIEPKIEELLARQRQIAGCLRERLGE